MEIRMINDSSVNEKEIKEKVSNMTDKELIEYNKSSWSDYAESMNWWYCQDCDGFQDVCRQGCPCWHWRLSDDEIEKRGIK